MSTALAAFLVSVLVAAVACGLASRVEEARRAILEREAQIERLLAEASTLRAKLADQHHLARLRQVAIAVAQDIGEPIALVASGVEVLASAVDDHAGTVHDLRAHHDEVIPDLRAAIRRFRAIANELRGATRTRASMDQGALAVASGAPGSDAAATG